MSFDRTILGQTAGNLAALDFGAENARLAELEDEIAQARRATERANARIAEIGDELVSQRQPAARAVAVALLAEVEPSRAAEASPSTETLDNEREALRAGVRELQDGIRVREAEMNAVRAAARKRMAEAAGPLVELLIGDARSAAERVRECHSALRAVHMATGAGAQEVRFTLDAVKGFWPDHGGLLPVRSELDVPADIAATLEAASNKGPAVKASIVRTVSMR